MTAARMGDRVTVPAFEGRVVAVSPDEVRVRDDAGNWLIAPRELVTVLAPPLKVGDEVDAVTAEALPVDSAVRCLTNGRTYMRPAGDAGLWHGDTRMAADAGGACRILHIGDTR